MKIQLLQPPVIPFSQPYINPDYGTVSTFLRDNPGARGIMYYSVLFVGDPKKILQSTTLKPTFLKDHIVLTGSVLDWRGAYLECSDQKFLEDCYEFIRKQTEIFHIKKDGPGWKVLP
jgi:hypothetical protein